MESINISGRSIGKELPCFIIAEAGVNHNGDINLGKKLIDIAKNAGADAVKFQLFKAENLVTENTGKAEYQKAREGDNESQLELLSKLELSKEDFRELARYQIRKRENSNLPCFSF